MFFCLTFLMKASFHKRNLRMTLAVMPQDPMALLKIKNTSYIKFRAKDLNCVIYKQSISKSQSLLFKSQHNVHHKALLQNQLSKVSSQMTIILIYSARVPTHDHPRFYVCYRLKISNSTLSI